MIAFVTSFRARALAQDWNYHVWLLERTMLSMLAQSGGKCHVVVACHEVPDISLARDPRVQFLSVGFKPPARNNDDMCVDKVLKLTVGARWALARGFEYVVFSDADDLMSNRIGGYVDAHRGENGWYCASEMFYTYGGSLLRYFDIPGMSAGPCVIIRSDLLSFESPPFSGAWTDILVSGGESNYLDLLNRRGEDVNVVAAIGLGHYRRLMSDAGHALEPLPFPANVVINHRDSTSFVAGGIGSYYQAGPPRSVFRQFLSRTKQRLSWLPTLRYATPSLRQEFLIPANCDIPIQYRVAGSIFWR